jgi:hypothetical protein
VAQRAAATHGDRKGPEADDVVDADISLLKARASPSVSPLAGQRRPSPIAAQQLMGAHADRLKTRPARFLAVSAVWILTTFHASGGGGQRPGL